ncbi:2-phosphosulfolactate phosphatase [Flammeovirgaceae bacterium SG7u.111]|nr:2-phosphosulfolactate phosphatase [Flammeovirgaceae bacterium SG7u.132]WPO33145.1 2-phosphosulfolactate phosphatase [Flammeovirgaceae bacterium SG7u.111]
MKQLEICYSPGLAPAYDFEEKTVVVTDIFRATSCMVSGIASGLKAIVPVLTLEEVPPFKEQGFLTAGERNGVKIPAFDFGNSPFDFMQAEYKGRSVVMTTTNGTKAIDCAKSGNEILIGAFLNISAVAKILRESSKDVVVLCAGWKNRFNLEDTLFAGALATMLSSEFDVSSDETRAAMLLYEQAKNNLLGFLEVSSHAQRLGKLNGGKDIAFCLKHDEFDSVPVLKNNQLIKYE